MRTCAFVVAFLLIHFPILGQNSVVDTLFCGDTLRAEFNPASLEAPADTFYVWLGNCQKQVRFDFTTADVPDGGEIYYLDLEGNQTYGGKIPYFGSNCMGENYFTDPDQYSIETSLHVDNCVLGFLEIYGAGVPLQDSIFQRNTIPADFKLSGDVTESARIHLNIPDGAVAVMFIVNYNPNEFTLLDALWDCTPECCITATGENVCEGEDIQLGSVEAAPVYRWTGPNGFQSNIRSPLISNASQADEGWYVLEGEYPFGCIGLDSVYISVKDPLVQLSPDSLSICAGSRTELQASGSIPFSWDMDASGLITADPQSAIVQPNQTTTYSISGIDEEGCTHTASATIVPVQLAFETEAIDPSCNGLANGSIQLQPIEGVSPFSIRQIDGTWLEGTTLNNLPVGAYQVDIRDAIGCEESVSIVLEDPAPMEVSVGLSSPTCVGRSDGEILLMPMTGTAPYEFSINGQLVDSLSGNYTAGSYPISVTDANGCLWESAATVEDPAPFLLDLGKNLKVREGKRLKLKAKANYTIDSIIWTDICKENCVTEFDWLPDSTQTVHATAWSDLGCEASASVNVLVKKVAKCHAGIYAPSAFSPNGDGYNERFTLFTDTEGGDVSMISKLLILNKWGRVVHSTTGLAPNDTGSGWDGYTNGQPATPGVYVWAATFLRDDGLEFVCSGSVTVLR